MSYNIKLDIELCSRKKISIGGLSNKIIADIEFVKLDEEPFIPASTIKGVLRTSIIKVSNLLTNNSINPTIHPSKMSKDIVTNMMGKPHDNIYSKVIVSNARKEECSTFVLSHVSIDDDTGISKENALYEREYASSMSRFKFEIDASSLTLEEARLLFLGLLEMKYQRIGRNGLVSVKIVKDNIPEDLAKDRIISHILEGLR